MDKEQTEYLFAKYPELYKGRHLPDTVNLMSYGFCCGNGWMHLLDVLSQQLTDCIEKKRYGRFAKLMHKRIEWFPGKYVSLAWIPKTIYSVEWWFRGVFRKQTDEEMIADQVKQKFGELRFYMSEATTEMQDFIYAAEAEAAKTCEECGHPGQRASKRGWMVTLCSVCGEKYGYPPFKKLE